MGKHDFLTPKAIANRIKAKGLQKLRWYCQMCEKQCRDENGFKCHTMSESHSRQMKLFAENPQKYISDYSRDFEKAFLQLCKLKGKRVKANMVYNELIANRQHTHMNSTHWMTLTAFVQYLGKSGKCRVDYTEKGWFIEYIDTSPLAQKRARAALRNSKLNETRDQIEARMIEEQIARAHEGDEKKEEASSEDEEARAFKPEDGAKLGFSLKDGVKLEKTKKEPLDSVLGKRKGDASGSTGAVSGSMGVKVEGARGSSQSDEERGGKFVKTENGRKRKSKFSDKPPLGVERHFTKSSKKRKRGKSTSMIDKLMNEIKNGQRYPVGWGPAAAKPKTAISSEKRSTNNGSSNSSSSVAKKSKSGKKREKSWVRKGIIVKIMNKKLGGGHYYKQKGTITKVPKKFEALVQLKSGECIQIDQTMLETVLPALSKRVLVLVGEHADKIGVLRSVDQEIFKAKVDLPDAGNVYISFDHICKIDKTYM